jgi:hypothetical protein
MSELLQFMYQGEVNVRHKDLQSFMKVAETLQIKGLTTSGSNQRQEEPNFNQNHSNFNQRNNNFNNQSPLDLNSVYSSASSADSKMNFNSGIWGFGNIDDL